MTRLLLEVGDRPRTTWTVKLDGAVFDPPRVLLIVMRPSSPSAVQYTSEYNVSDPAPEYPITRESQGVFYADLPLVVSGVWVRRWLALDATGKPISASETEFTVRKSATLNPLGPTP